MKSNYWADQNYKLHYYSAGDSFNPCIIFLHGFLGNGLDWDEIVNRLSSKFYCLAPDLPGHGKTTVKSDISYYTMEKVAALVVKFVQNVKISSPHLAGYSMGGRLALFLAVSDPGVWNKIVLASASPGLKTASERAKRLKQDNKLAEELDKKNLDAFLDSWYQQPIFETILNKENYPSLLSRRLKNRSSELARSLHMMGTGNQPSLWDKCKSIQIPILLLAGEFDSKFCSIMSEMSRYCPESIFQIIKNSGHNIHFEQPLVFVDYVYKFLTGSREKD